MHYAHAGLAHDGKAEMEQVIVVLMHGSVQRVFDGYHGGVDALLCEALKNLVEALARYNLHRFTQELMDSLLAECPFIALKRNSL
jgi:hypothetical protein